MSIFISYYFRISYRNAAKVSEKIITVSNFSKERITKILGIEDNKVEVINSAVYEKLITQEPVPFSIIKI